MEQGLRTKLLTAVTLALVFASGGVTGYAVAARAARQEGLGVNAGHDLNLENLGVFLAELGGVDEVSIGHALIADALEFGLSDTVRRYVEICLAHGS